MASVLIERTPHQTRIVAGEEGWWVALEAERIHGSELHRARDAEVAALLRAWGAGVRAGAFGPSGGPAPREAARLGLSRGDVAVLEFTFRDGRRRRVHVGAGDDDGRVLQDPRSLQVFRGALPPLPEADPAAWLDRRLFPLDPEAVTRYRLGDAPWSAVHGEAGRAVRDRLLGLRWAATLAIGGNFHNYEGALPVIGTLAVETSSGVSAVKLTAPPGRAELMYAWVDNALLQLDEPSREAVDRLLELNAP